LSSVDKEYLTSRGIQSIEIGCAILQALSFATAPMQLKDIAQVAGMPASKVRFYLVSFLREGMIVQDSKTGRYSLGPAIIRLGLSAIRQSDLVSLAQEPMLELRDKTGLTCFLSIWGNRGPTIVQKFEGDEYSPLNVRVGFGLPLTSSPTGNIYCAWMPKRDLEPFLRLERDGKDVTGVHVVGNGELNAAVEMVRSHGHAVSRNRVNEGYSAAAAPLFDAIGDLAGALSLVGPFGLW
jgi:DNA-binding IclR family transcriptional regulator